MTGCLGLGVAWWLGVGLGLGLRSEDLHVWGARCKGGSRLGLSARA